MTNGLLPSYDVRAIAVDPGNQDSVYFATTGGLAQHDGTTFGASTWTSYTMASSGLPSNDLQSLVVDRFPSAQK